VTIDDAADKTLTDLTKATRSIKAQDEFALVTKNDSDHYIQLKAKGGYVPVLFGSESQTVWTIRMKKDAVRVIIDAGHGGKDVGTISYHKHYEKDFTLDMAKLVYAELLNTEGIIPVLTRADDHFISLDYRAQYARNHQGDVFISIHANSNDRSSIQGTETYYSDARGKEMASYFHQNILKATKLKDRKMRQAKYFVLRNNSVPAILCEIGYYSNKTDEAQMLKDSFRKRVAQSIAESMKQYVNERLAP
jgi:N-acetylmuramoyl-L-alanine amidase